MRRGRACGIVVVLSLATLITGAVGTVGTVAGAADRAAGRTSLVAGQQVIIRYCNDQEARITEPSTFNCGSSTPRLPQNNRDHAPPASTTD